MSAKNKGMKLQPLCLQLRYSRIEWPNLQENALSAAVLAAAFAVLVSSPLYNSAVANITLKHSLLVIAFPLMAFIGRKKTRIFLPGWTGSKFTIPTYEKQVRTDTRTTTQLAHNYTTEKCSKGFDFPSVSRPKKRFKGSTKQTPCECLRRDLSASPLGACLDAEPGVHYRLFVKLERCAPNGYKDVLTSEVRLTGLQLTVTPITDLIALPGTL